MNNDEKNDQDMQQLQKLAPVQDKLVSSADTALVATTAVGNMFVGLFKIALNLAWWCFLIKVFFSAPGWAILFLFIIIFFVINK